MNSARLSFDAGQSSAIDPQAGGHPLVSNILMDNGGANVRRPGARALFATTNATGGVIGAHVFQNQLIYVTADRKIWRVHPATPENPIALSSDDTATQLPGSKRAVFIDDDVRCIIAGGGLIQQWIPGEVLSRRLDSNLTTTVIDASTGIVDDPPLTTHVCFLDQYIVANDLRFPNHFVWSGQGDNTVTGPPYTPGHDRFPALNFTTADANPDSVMAVHSNSRELFVFGSDSLQVYGVGSDPFLPFQNAITMNLGCSAAYSVIAIDSAFAFLDDKRRIVLTDGRSYEVLSDPISSTLRELSAVSDCHGMRLEIGSFALLLWVFPTAKRAFYFERTTKKWGEWSGYNAALDLGAYAYWPARDTHVAARASVPNVTAFDFDSAEDLDGGPIVMERITAFEDHGSFAAKANVRMRYMLRRGVVPFGETDVFEVTQRDDLGAWAPWTRLDLGDVSDRNPMVENYPGGVYRMRQHRYRYSGTSRFVLAGVDEQIEMREVGN